MVSDGPSSQTRSKPRRSFANKNKGSAISDTNITHSSAVLTPQNARAVSQVASLTTSPGCNKKTADHTGLSTRTWTEADHRPPIGCPSSATDPVTRRVRAGRKPTYFPDGRHFCDIWDCASNRDRVQQALTATSQLGSRLSNGKRGSHNAPCHSQPSSQSLRPLAYRMVKIALHVTTRDAPPASGCYPKYHHFRLYIRGVGQGASNGLLPLAVAQVIDCRLRVDIGVVVEHWLHTK